MLRWTACVMSLRQSCSRRGARCSERRTLSKAGSAEMHYQLAVYSPSGVNMLPQAGGGMQGDQSTLLILH